MPVVQMQVLEGISKLVQPTTDSGEEAPVASTEKEEGEWETVSVQVHSCEKRQLFPVILSTLGCKKRYITDCWGA